jgi:hypothetical protein
MTRFETLLCSLNSHRFDETDEFNRCWCSRCGTRQPKHHAQIQTEEQRGRELNRPKTRAQRSRK